MATILSILEGDLPPEKAAKLETNFAEGALEPGMLRMSLVRNGSKCKIITLWESREALNAAKSRGTPKTVLMFRYAGVEGSLLNYDVIGSKEK